MMRRTPRHYAANRAGPRADSVPLGHASIQTTERYLGSRQNLKEAVNDRLGLDT